MIDHFHSCESPLLVRNKYTHKIIEVPCGKCSACLLRANTRYVPLIFREASCHKYQVFFTLTYSNDFLPKCDLHAFRVPAKYLVNYFDFYEKSKDYIKFCNYLLPFCPASDAQKFIKRLRERVYREFGLRKELRYFITADYGSTCFRPHWHGLLFFSNDQVHEKISSLISDAWTFNDNREFFPLGRVDVQDAYAAAKYVSHYVNTDVDRPAILRFRAFAPRALFSSSPSFGSAAVCLESPQEIVRNGLAEIHIYDNETFEYRPVRLTSYLVRRLFPAIPSFSSLDVSERFRIYDIFTKYLPSVLQENEVTYTAADRRIALRWRMLHDSFFCDYITLNDSSFTEEQVNRKLDLVFYVVKRLSRASASLNVSIYEYDSFIDKYLYNCSQQALKFQFEFEDRYMIKNRDCARLSQFIDLSLPVPSNYERDSYDDAYFTKQKVNYVRSLKRKLDNAYLERHPQFKQFHK